MKIGRNELCPCGSGKKYKKCCIDKAVELPERNNALSAFSHLLSYEEVNALSTDEIIQRLESIGIPFDQTGFLDAIERFYSAEQLSENWFKKYSVTAKGREEDFPWLAACVLWERLAPENMLSMEQMDDLLVTGFEYLKGNNFVKGCDYLLMVWEALKYHFNPIFKNLDYLDEQYNGSFYIRNICQDLEMALYNAGFEDPTYFEKRITYCREFCKYFPGESETIVHNMKRAIAETYAMLGDYEHAEIEFSSLVEEYPDNPWGYISWGDIFMHKHDYHKARELYEKGLTITKDKGDISAVRERLEDLMDQMN